MLFVSRNLVLNAYSSGLTHPFIRSLLIASSLSLAACDGDAISTFQTSISTPAIQPAEHQVSVPRGGRVFIDLMRNNSTEFFNSSTLSIYTPPTNGDITRHSNTEVEYTHRGGTDANSAFSYVVADYNGQYSSPVSVNVEIDSLSSVRTVNVVNEPSEPSNTFVINGRESISFNALQNLPNANPATLRISQQGSKGYLSIAGTSITYTSYTGAEDRFSYAVKNSDGSTSGPYWVYLTTGGDNSGTPPPGQTDHYYEIGAHESITINALTNLPNANPDTLRISQQGTRGFLRIAGGNITYKHYGTGTEDQFSFSVKNYDGSDAGPFWVYLSIGNGGGTPVEPPAPIQPPTENWWTPRASENLRWQIQLQGDIRLISGVDVYAVDYTASQASINAAKATGAKVMCYISAGSAENWRADFGRFPNSVIGNAYQGWPGEWWLDIRNINALAPIMRARIAACAAKGFDAIDADNVNVFENNSGFNVSRQDSINYIRWLANESHNQGLAFSLKNAETLVVDLINDVDMMQSESCYVYGNCANASLLSAADKPVFAVEYSDAMNISTFRQACNATSGYNMEMIYRNRSLTATGVYETCN